MTENDQTNPQPITSLINKLHDMSNEIEEVVTKNEQENSFIKLYFDINDKRKFQRRKDKTMHNWSDMKYMIEEFLSNQASEGNTFTFETTCHNGKLYITSITRTDAPLMAGKP